MAKNLFHNLIFQVKEVMNLEFGISDVTGVVIACTDETKVGQSDLQILKVLESHEQYVIFQGVTYHKIVMKDKVEFIIHILSEDEECRKYLLLIAMNIVNIKKFYDEKFDKNNFMKGILLGNVSPEDIAIRAKDLHIVNHAARVVFSIKTKGIKDVFIYEILQELFPNKTKDFVVILNDESIVLIKELKTKEDTKEIERTANMLVDTLNTESMVKAMVGVGTVVDTIAQINRSFQEAQTALAVGSVFESDKLVIHYDNLGLGRLIYQIPESLCRLFLKEVFKQGSVESLDSEYMFTIQKFFENNLNVSETSRQMYVHRNTLVYRLEKIQKATGLDLTRFDDAIVLKFALLVKRYLDKGVKIV